MNASPTQIRANCPACGAPVSAEVRQVIDVGQESDLKRRLLRGQLNVAVCPNCSARVAVAIPLAYHDPQKELLLTLIPSQMELGATEQDKTIGELTNLVMNSLPPEKRKAYLFQPKTFFSLDSLLSEILRADGITDEMMQAQKQRALLMQELLSLPDDEAGFRKFVEEKRESLDYEFFLFLSASVDQAREEGEDDLARELGALRDRLNALLSPTPVRPSESLKGALTREELVERLFEHRDGEMLESLVAIARPALDYQFFQTLTAQIEAAQSQGASEKAQQLTELRARILDLVDKLDKEAQQALEQASALLARILSSEDIKAAAEQHVEEIDAALLTVLEANLVAAKQSDRSETVEKLSSLKEHVVSLLEARLPPEMRLLNQLVSEEELEKRRSLLQEQAELVGDDFLKLLRLVAEDLRSQNQEAAAQRLEDILPDAEAVAREDSAEAPPEESP